MSSITVKTKVEHHAGLEECSYIGSWTREWIIHAPNASCVLHPFRLLGALAAEMQTDWLPKPQDETVETPIVASIRFLISRGNVGLTGKVGLWVVITSPALWLSKELYCIERAALFRLSPALGEFHAKGWGGWLVVPVKVWWATE